MELTPLEFVLLAAFLTLLSAVLTRLLFSGKFVTKETCAAEREKQCLERQQVCTELENLRDGQKVQFRMLRALIAHSTMPDEKKAEVLNQK